MVPPSSPSSSVGNYWKICEGWVETQVSPREPRSLQRQRGKEGLGTQVFLLASRTVPHFPQDPLCGGSKAGGAVGVYRNHSSGPADALSLSRVGF